MNYSKFKYEQGQKAKESRRKSSNTSIKEMKYRPKIGQGDFDTKTRKVEEFLSEGHKVKVTIMFRGREMQHPELGRHILDRVIDQVSRSALVEAYPKQDGRNMVMVLGSRQKAAKQCKKAAPARPDCRYLSNGRTSADTTAQNTALAAPTCLHAPSRPARPTCTAGSIAEQSAYSAPRAVSRATSTRGTDRKIARKNRTTKNPPRKGHATCQR